MPLQSVEFERPIVEIEKKIEELRIIANGGGMDVDEEIRRLEKKARQMTRDLYLKLNRWQRTLLARHPKRPYTLDYIRLMCSDFIELHGDRSYADDRSLVGGMAWFEGVPIMVMGQQKGRTTKEKVYRNFGMAHPEGYRKALRLMKIAEKFGRPILTLIDTPGAYPGIGAEERGQAEAIARNQFEMATLRVPFIAAVIGEGGSGGALALGVGNRVIMQENAIYSVISPEGCASILWRDTAKAPEAAEAMKITAKDLSELGVVDEIVREPMGGAHRDHNRAASLLRRVIRRHLGELMAMSPEELIAHRYDRFRRLGVYTEK
ncbi:MAG: acetyl-CoA carboxylase carboxyltransferase subunit alpha [Nitrospinae bacterium]|nr:acetyl-CoA carboxylase carboxyltransferase subunit alpha [Nitrospinota bacterium]